MRLRLHGLAACLPGCFTGWGIHTGDKKLDGSGLGMTLGKLMKPKHSTVESSRLLEAEPAALATGLSKKSKSSHHAVRDEEVLNRMLEAEDNPGVMISWDELVSGLRHRRAL